MVCHRLRPFPGNIKIKSHMWDRRGVILSECGIVSGNNSPSSYGNDVEI